MQVSVVVLKFRCPGCDRIHEVYIAPDCDPNTGARWNWNGSIDKPMISPSLLFQIEFTDPSRSNFVFDITPPLKRGDSD